LIENHYDFLIISKFKGFKPLENMTQILILIAVDFRI